MKFTAIFPVLLLTVNLFAQNSSKKSLGHEVYDSWNDILKPSISNNGILVSYEVNPPKGYGVLWVYNECT